MGIQSSRNSPKGVYLSNISQLYKYRRYRSNGALTARIYPNQFKDFPVTKHHIILNVAVNVRAIYRSPFLQNKDARNTLEMSLSGHQSRLRRGGEEKNVTVLSCEKWSLLRCSETCYCLRLIWQDWLASHLVGLTGTHFTGGQVESGASVDISDNPLFVEHRTIFHRMSNPNLLTKTPDYTCC